MKIKIEALETEAIIGVLDFEREREQRVLLDLELDYDYSAGNFIDYAEIAGKLSRKIREKRFYLLEEALEDLKEYLKELYPDIRKLKLEIKKPDILKNCIVSVGEIWDFS